MSDLENRYWQEPGVHTELDLRVLAKRAEHKAGEGGIVDRGAFSWDTGCNSMGKTPDDDACRLLGWFLETWRRLWPTLSEAEMVHLLCRPWRLTEVMVPEGPTKRWETHHMTIFWEGLEQTPLSKAIENTPVRGLPAEAQ